MKKKEPKIHYHGDSSIHACCGIWLGGPTMRANRDRVTCKRCIRSMIAKCEKEAKLWKRRLDEVT